MLVQIDFPQVAHETIDNEVVIINFKNGHYYSLENTGRAVWSGIERGMSTDEIAAQLASSYEGDPAEITNGVNTLIAELLKEGLVIPATAATKAPTDAPAPAPPPAPVAGTKFQPPVLLKFDDMEGLLLLDLAHDEDQ